MDILKTEEMAVCREKGENNGTDDKDVAADAGSTYLCFLSKRRCSSK